MTFRTERMSDSFVKHHLEGPWPFQPVLHHFTAPDVGPPHDHPWGFTSSVLSGGYVEQVFHIEGPGRWRTELVERKAGTSHTVAAGHIHRIVDLPGGDCWTLVMAQPAERVSRFWRFAPGLIEERYWHEPDYRAYAGAAVPAA